MSTPVIISEADPGWLSLRSRYDPDVVAAVKGIPGRRWNPNTKTWFLPVTELELIRATFPRAAYNVKTELPPPSNTLDIPAEPVPGEKNPSWAHQRRAFHYAHNREAALLDMAMGTGKSKVALEILRVRKHRWTLILCPLSVVNVWPEQVRRYLPAEHIWTALLTGSVPNKDQQLKALMRDAAAMSSVEQVVIVCNYDSAWRSPLRETLLSLPWDCVILDESHRAKAVPRYSRTADGSKQVSSGHLAAFVHELGHPEGHEELAPKQRLCLSGTPLAHSPLDAWSQFMFLDPRVFGPNFYSFRDRYAVMEEEGNSSGQTYKTIVGWRDLDDMKRRYYSLAFHVSMKDAELELPPVQHEYREFPLTTSEKPYHELKNELKAKLANGEITPANGAVAFLRLQQITSGIAKFDDKTLEYCGSEKMEALAELLGDIDPEEKVVIFTQFRPDLTRLAELAAKCGRRYGEISGSRKDGLDETAQYREGLTLVGVQIQAGGVGIDLSRARYCVYLSPGMSLANYEQSLARVHRPGQERPVIYYHLLATGTVDKTLYRALQAKKDLVATVIGDLS